jgi:hypothetical protein
MSETIVASSLNLKDHAGARSARCVVRDIASTYCLANVAICWLVKTVGAIDYRHSKSVTQHIPCHIFRECFYRGIIWVLLDEYRRQDKVWVVVEFFENIILT